MFASVCIEDNFEDVLNKAMVGLRLRKQDLCEKTGLSRDSILALLNGVPHAGDLLLVAKALNLHGPSLVRMADGILRPPIIEVTGLSGYNTPFPVPGYQEMTVNSYLVRDPGSQSVVAFDSGASAEAMLADIRERNLNLEMVLVTHAHGDHIAALDEMLEATGHPPVWVNKRESISNAESFTEGKVFTVGQLSIESRLTSGHSAGGTSFVVSGLDRPVAVVGDSLFCYSQGGAPSAYAEALENNRTQLLSLPDETILCPGHGPVTTVAEEKAHNPFYPEYK